MKIKDAMEGLKEYGFDILGNKAIFRLNDGALEVCFDQDGNALKTEIHDKTIFVSNDLLDRSVESVVFELNGIEEDE